MNLWYKRCLKHLNRDKTCLQSNLQSIGNKFPEFTTLVDHYHQKSIGITESWCSEDIQDAEIKLNNHSIHRGDKQSGKGGGVILYMLNSLRSLPCSALNSLEINDSVWCTITLSNSDLLLLGLVYRSPNSCLSNTEKLIQTLHSLQRLQRHTHLGALVCGLRSLH